MTEPDRSEDAANRAYYTTEMLTRRAIVVLEVDVEWRPDDPDYAMNVIETDSTPPDGARLLNWRFIGAAFGSAMNPRQRPSELRAELAALQRRIEDMTNAKPVRCAE